MYIYLITNKINLKKYVGKTEQSSPIKRWRRHIYDSFNGSECYLHRSMRRNGVDNFHFQIIDCCNNPDELNEMEIEYISEFNTYYGEGYNSTLGGEGCSGRVMSDETKKKISQKAKNRTISTEHRKKITEKLKGRKVSDETKQKMSVSHKGKKLSKEHIIKLSENSKGKNSKRVAQFSLSGELLNTYDSVKEAAHTTKSPYSHICGVCSRAKYRKSAGGFIWRYV